MTPSCGRRFAGEGARATNDAAGRAASLKTQGPSTSPADSQVNRLAPLRMTFGNLCETKNSIAPDGCCSSRAQDFTPPAPGATRAVPYRIAALQAIACARGAFGRHLRDWKVFSGEYQEGNL